MDKKDYKGKRPSGDWVTVEKAKRQPLCLQLLTTALSTLSREDQQWFLVGQKYLCFSSYGEDLERSFSCRLI